MPFAEQYLTENNKLERRQPSYILRHDSPAYIFAL